MRSSRILSCLGIIAAWASAAPVYAQTEPDSDSREEELFLAQNSFNGPTGGIRVVDAGSGPKGTFRLALNTEFFLTHDFFLPNDKAQHFAGNLSLSITPTEYLEVFGSVEVTSAWDDMTDPMLIQRIGGVLLGLKGYHWVHPWVAIGGDASVAVPGGVGDMKASFRATSFGFRANAALDFRTLERRELPLIARFNAQYWFDNTAKLTEGIEDLRYGGLTDALPLPLETRHFLTSFERFAYGVNRTDSVRIGTGFEAPLKAGRVGLHPLLEWRWDIPVNRQGFQCLATAIPNDDGCLANEKLKAFPMALTFGLRMYTPPRGLAFTVAADIGLTGTSTFVRELAPTAPYNVIIGIAYAYDPQPPSPAPEPAAEPVPEPGLPATGRVHGRVVEMDRDQPIANAVVSVAGQDLSPQITDDEGRFVTYDVRVGAVLLEIHHHDFEPAQCETMLPGPTIADQAEPQAEVTCSLTPLSTDGRLRLLIVDREGKPMPKVPVTVRGPSEHVLVSDEQGVAVVEKLPPGDYAAHVDDPVYLVAVSEFEVFAREEAMVKLRILPKPSRPRVVVGRKRLTLRGQVSFATGSDEILPNSEPILLEVADVLLRAPNLELIEIQGHTDNRGNHQLNMELSQKRAEAVRRWLVEHGVEPDRLIAKGYGPTRPIVPNITQHNRARNRRVQFRIVRRAELTAAAP